MPLTPLYKDGHEILAGEDSLSVLLAMGYSKEPPVKIEEPEDLDDDNESEDEEVEIEEAE